MSACARKERSPARTDVGAILWYPNFVTAASTHQSQSGSNPAPGVSIPTLPWSSVAARQAVPGRWARTT